MTTDIGLHVAKADITEHRIAITLLSTSGCDEGAYFPAQDVQVYGLAAVTQLKDFCELAIKTHEKLKQKP